MKAGIAIYHSNMENMIHSRPSGLTFSQIVIEKIVKGKKYVAKFEFKFETFKVETTVGGCSVDEVVDKTEKFLQIKLRKEEVTLPK